MRSEELDLEFSNGVRRTYERILNAGRGAAVIVPMRDADTVLLVREWGAGLQHYELGLPKGRLDPGESVTEGANRELKEEAGYGARRLTVLGRVSLAAAYMNHMTDVVLAQELYPERLPGDEPEEMEVVPWKLDELHILIARDDVTEGRTMAALFMAREYLAGRYQPA
jgi:ADP-ribose diphosphatase